MLWDVVSRSQLTLRALILDGHSSAALAFTRSLGRSNSWVAVGYGKGDFAPAGHSRFCDYRWEYPPPEKSVERFIEVISNFVIQHGIQVILPMTDSTMWPLSAHRASLPAGVDLVAPSVAALELVNDKYRTIQLAQEVGVPAPETVLVNNMNMLDQCRGWEYPIVVKDRFSMRWFGDIGVHGSASYAYSWEELQDMVLHRIKVAGDVLVQKFISGAGIGFSCLVARDAFFLPFQWIRIREKDPRGSGSSARMSEPLDLRVIEYSQRLLRGTGIEGICMVEFKRQAVSGETTLMEINGRPWGSLQLPIFCGIDYPIHLLSWTRDRCTPPEKIDYREGITCRWLAAELVHLENVWEGKPPNWPAEYPNFWSSLLKICLPWSRRMKFEDIWIQDPIPGLVGLNKWIKDRLHSRTVSGKTEKA